jgi:site-specific recombinase XerD
MLQCGLRIGEVSTLNIENVWRGGYVHPAVHLPRGTTKGHIARFVDIPEPLRQLIAAHVAELFNSSPDTSQTSPLFWGRKVRRRLNVSGIGRIVSRISEHTLGRHINPHLLRHTFATVLMKYTNIRVVQQLLGHASLNTTQIYTHPSSEDCKNAVNKAFNR